MIRHIIVWGILVACLAASVPVQAQETQTDHKAVIIHYTLSGDSLTVRDSRIIYGYAPNNLGHDDLAVTILTRDNRSLRQLGVEDPRILYYDGGAKVLDAVDFSIIVPFSPAMGFVEVSNGTSGAMMSRADLSGTVMAFCTEHRDDRDCAAVPGSLSPWVPAAVIIVLLAAAGIGGLLYFRKSRAQNPPGQS